MWFISGYNIDEAVEARYTKQNTSTLPFKFRISLRKKSSNIGNLFLPFKIAQKTAFEVKGLLYTTSKVIQRLFIIDLYT